MVVRDAILAFIHFALILMLAAILFAEVVLYAPRMPRALLERLQRIDLAYGIVAGLIVVSGLSRLFWGLKGASFYTHNPVFWTKMIVFIIIALLSLPPTFHYLRIAKEPGDVIAVDDASYARTRVLLLAECVLLLVLPLLAALMARGL